MYAYYKVNHRLEDKTVHDIIDKLNLSLRAKDKDGKERKREFFEMSAEDAYDILHCIAKINGLEDNLVLVESTAKEMDDEDEATTKRKSTQLPKTDWLIEQGIVNIGDEVYLINHLEEIATKEDARTVKIRLS